MKRRKALGLLASYSLLANIPASVKAVASELQQEKKLIDWSGGLIPLYCIAYIDPSIKSQQNQEYEVSKFPIAIVPQDARRHFVKWRNKVKSHNAKIKFLAYQMVIEETTVPGPGHDELRKIKSSWSKYPGGYLPTLKIKKSSSIVKRRIYDPRNEEWKAGFIESCTAVLDSYDYNGLFLDQCTIFEIASLSPAVKNEMRDALQEVILVLRNKYPDKVIIGNSKYSWNGLNGELNESRPKDFIKETEVFKGHVLPRLEMFHSFVKNKHDLVKAKENFELALERKAFYGASPNYQKVRWYGFFDEVLKKYTII